MFVHKKSQKAKTAKIFTLIHQNGV